MKWYRTKTDWRLPKFSSVTKMIWYGLHDDDGINVISFKIWKILGKKNDKSDASIFVNF